MADPEGVTRAGGAQGASMAKCTRVAGGLLVLLLSAGSDVAGASGYEIEKIALDGETAPDSGGRTYGSLDSYAVDLNAAGEVAFGALLSGSPPAWGVFVDSGGGAAARALSGDAAPAPLGGTYVAFGLPNLDEAGDVSVGALVRLSPTDTANALVLAGAGGDTLLVSELDAAPGAGGTLEVSMGDTGFHARGPGGAPVFRSDVIGGSASAGVFVGTSSAVALAGDQSPAGGTYLYLDSPGANADGKVVFPATLTGAAVDSGVFVDTGGGATTLLLSGDLDPEGETYRNFYLPQVSPAGDVLFLADWEPDGLDGGIYVQDAGGTRTVVRTDQVLPGTDGGSVDSLGGPAHFSSAGTVTFSASVVGGSVAGAVFVADASGGLHLVARSGDPVPGAPGQTFASFGVAASNGAGQVAFAATSDTGVHGVFLASPPAPPVPGLSPLGLAALAALLLLLAAAPRGGRAAAASAVESRR
jgi:hypothetical protein